MPLIAELEFIWIAAREPVALMPAADLYSAGWPAGLAFNSESFRYTVYLDEQYRFINNAVYARRSYRRPSRATRFGCDEN